MEDAWSLTAPGLTREEFAAKYASQQARRARVQAVEGAAAALVVRSGTLVLVREGDGWRVVEPDLAEEAREVLTAFLSAADSGDFAQAYRLLASELRARYTPERLEQDFRAEPLAKERLTRARGALGSDPIPEGRQVLFPIAEGKAVRLVHEDEGYRVMALE
jgi:hypothetical protein